MKLSMKRSRISKRQSGLNTDKLKGMWDKSKPKGTEGDEKKIRVFNQHSYNQKGRIKLDNETVVTYDYSKEEPVTKVERGSTIQEKRKEFTLPKYPVLRGIMETAPIETDKHAEMDLFIVKSTNSALLWKDNEYQLQ